MRSHLVIWLVAGLSVLPGGCRRPDSGSAPLPAGAAVERTGAAEDLAAIKAAVEVVPVRPMSGPGLAGVVGGARVKLLKKGRHDVWLPVPLTDARQVPARSVAVIPTNGMRLEMHRTVECLVGGAWREFDPSSLQPAVPMQPWHGVAMARTTIEDEEIAMKPRMGVSPGCPYGHELEFMGSGVSFTGRDFFWTMAKPLAEFDVGAEVARQARERWRGVMDDGAPCASAAGILEAKDQLALGEALKDE